MVMQGKIPKVVVQQKWRTVPDELNMLLIDFAPVPYIKPFTVAEVQLCFALFHIPKYYKQNIKDW